MKLSVKWILVLLVMGFAINLFAQHKKYINSLLLSNRAEMRELLFKDSIPYTFFANGFIKEIETRKATYYSMIIAHTSRGN